LELEVWRVKRVWVWEKYSGAERLVTSGVLKTARSARADSFRRKEFHLFDIAGGDDILNQEQGGGGDYE
jgi:hypothetical protein